MGSNPILSSNLESDAGEMVRRLVLKTRFRWIRGWGSTPPLSSRILVTVVSVVILVYNMRVPERSKGTVCKTVKPSVQIRSLIPKVMGVLQLWRVLHRTVNPVPRGKHSRFESVDTHQKSPVLRRLLSRRFETSVSSLRWIIPTSHWAEYPGLG